MITSAFFLGGKNADSILKLLVREIKLSEHVERRRRLRRVRFDDVQFDVVDVVQNGPFPPFPESPGHVQGHPQGGFVRHSLLFAGWAAFPGTPRKRSYKFLRRITYLCRFRATNAVSKGYRKFYGGSSTFASLGPTTLVHKCSRICPISQPGANRAFLEWPDIR